MTPGRRGWIVLLCLVLFAAAAWSSTQSHPTRAEQAQLGERE